LTKHLLQGLLSSFAVGGALILLGALALSFTPDPNAWLQPAGLFCAASTALFGGWFTSRRHGHAALLCGALHGMLLCGMMLLASLFFAGEAATHASGYSALASALLHVGVILLSIAGAYLGGRAKQARRRKH
jgi:putative membrane protein (TIGR04086 family)